MTRAGYGITTSMRNRLVALLAVVALVVMGCSSGSSDDAFKQGRSIYGNRCSACHGNSGQGGIGPALGEVISTYPYCDDHKQWVGLGSEGWLATIGPTYGATHKPLKGGMPRWLDQLTEQEIAAVVAFERTQYGGLDWQEASKQCGLEEPSESP